MPVGSPLDTHSCDWCMLACHARGIKTTQITAAFTFGDLLHHLPNLPWITVTNFTLCFPTRIQISEEDEEDYCERFLCSFSLKNKDLRNMCFKLCISDCVTHSYYEIFIFVNTNNSKHTGILSFLSVIWKVNHVLPWTMDTTAEFITGHLVRPGNSSACGKLYKQVIYKCHRWSPSSSNTVMSNVG